MRRIAALLFVLAACRGGAAEGTPDAAASPQASAMPAPLANAPTTTTSATAASIPIDAGPSPVPLRGDETLAPDSLPRDGLGYTLSAVLRQADLTAPPHAPEVNAAGIEAAKKKTELRFAIDLAPTRMRAVLAGSGFVLPTDTEIRARSDRFGQLVVWPGAATYRPLAPGAMRALLGERRFDVAPISSAEVIAKDEIGKRIGIRTRKVEVTTRVAKATFEIGRLADLGDGGVLLCRFVLDLMNAPPSAAVCGTDELPMRADIRWTGRGSIGFDVTGVLKRTDLPLTPLSVPPQNASFAASPFPVAGVTSILSPPELAAFRTGPVDAPLGSFAGSDGLVVTNGTEQLRLVQIDGVSVAWVAPGARDVIRGFVRGRYVATWRTFLGESVEPPVTMSIPGLMAIGVPDAGAR